MKRREFIALVGGAAAVLPLGARGQKSAMPVIGFLHAGTADGNPRALVGFRQGLKEEGFIEGQNLAIEFRWANNQADRLSALAADLVHRKVAVIVSGGGGVSALAAKAATSTIPIVLAFGSDPVKLGLITSLNKPGGNVTGATFFTSEIVAKRLDLLCKLVPQAMTVAYLRAGHKQASVAHEEQAKDFLAAARALGRQPLVLYVDSDQEFEAAFVTLVDRRIGALHIASHPLFDNDKLLAALALQHKVPAIYQRREFAEAGGLMSYGAKYSSAFRIAGLYVGQILKGAKPADLPFQQSTTLELVINLKTAKTIGLTVPAALLAEANEVIE